MIFSTSLSITCMKGLEHCNEYIFVDQITFSSVPDFGCPHGLWFGSLPDDIFSYSRDNLGIYFPWLAPPVLVTHPLR